MPRLLQTVTVGWLISKLTDRQLGVLVAKPSSDDLAYLAGLVNSGQLTPMIDREYELSDLPEALRYLGSGQARGKLVVTM
jgi:NADPH:quinone reductase-like Zn-dependent oxidoreductase